MLKPKTDRLNYGHLLTPPDGFMLDKAVGTTYSMDLEALTAVCICMGLNEETDSSLSNNPIGMLHALQKVSERVVIFCESGQIKTPTKPNPLCILLEKMVVEVKLPYNEKIGRFPAFHPKMWLMVFKNSSGIKRYRLVVMSRNLTFDRSWDVSVAFEGKPSGYSKAGYELRNFMEFLGNKLSEAEGDRSEQLRITQSLYKELDRVYFEVDDKKFSDLEVFPMGIGSKSYNMPDDKMFTDTFHEMLIVSPFFTASVIEELNREEMGLTGAKRTLITRKSELSKIKPEQADNFTIYVMKDDIYNGENQISDDADETQEHDYQNQDIHAKIYMKRKYSEVDLYIGSMNASFAAISNCNVELMVGLKSANRYLNTEKMLQDIFGGSPDDPSNPFELAMTEDMYGSNEETESDKLERILKNVCRMNPIAEVIEHDDRYDVRVMFEEYDSSVIEDTTVTVSPLQLGVERAIDRTIMFANLEVTQISQFYKIAVAIKDCRIERLLMIPTEGIPDERDAQIVKDVVGNRRDFIEYVSFVLGDDYLLSSMESKKIEQSGVYKGHESMAMPAVYEKMLKTALQDPDRLREISYVMKQISDNEIIPEEFRSLYETFQNTLNMKNRRSKR